MVDASVALWLQCLEPRFQRPERGHQKIFFITKPLCQNRLDIFDAAEKGVCLHPEGGAQEDEVDGSGGVEFTCNGICVRAICGAGDFDYGTGRTIDNRPTVICW